MNNTLTNLPDGAVQWNAPETVVMDHWKALRRQFVLMAFRTGLASLVCLLAVRIGFGHLFPQKIWTILIIFAGVGSGNFLLAAIALRRPTAVSTYFIDERGVHVPSRERPLSTWTNIDSFTLAPHPRLPGYAVLNLHLKLGQARRIPMPEDRALFNQVHRAMKEKLQERLPLKRHSPLTGFDWIFGTFISAVCLSAFAYWLWHFQGRLHLTETDKVLVQLPMLLGPGTLAALLRFRRRATAQLFSLAIVLNMISWLAMISLVLARVCHNLKPF